MTSDGLRDGKGLRVWDSVSRNIKGFPEMCNLNPKLFSSWPTCVAVSWVGLELHFSYLT